ncbi:YaiI/YqxD family protein [Aliivibrio fischeri]|uniref:YaiI/YqxD family protein n=1 Tax=Aliivibrio fischeri TaxID=668 RepID=UPI0012D869FB|nr:YaiI/YqxD family protein [Aliivibrio fischeri]MUK78754.1 YaiI/YqxD family protein [Aliivibrio fischeri]
MQIWVDADACPKVVKEVLFRAATRTGIQLTLVANHYIPVPSAANIRSMQVEAGFDVADDEIVKRSEAGDLVISADIPLAAELIEKKVQVLNPRGELYTEATIKARLNIRDFMDTMRASGIQTGGPALLSQTERREFANQLDRILAKAKI